MRNEMQNQQSELMRQLVSLKQEAEVVRSDNVNAQGEFIKLKNAIQSNKGLQLPNHCD